MSEAASGRRGGLGAGRLDPTVRTLLRAFLSPAVADRYASALQPIAVADRDAALAGAVSTLRARFFVLPEELAVALVEDAGWSVADVSTMLGLPTMEVRAALREAAGAAAPRIGAHAPPHLDGDPAADDAAMVDALLSDLPAHRRDAGAAAAEPDGSEPVDVELSTSLPAHLGRPSLEARFRRADRIQHNVVNLTIVGIIAMVALAILATRPPADDDTLPEDSVVDVDPGPGPTATASPADTPAPTPTPTTSPSPALPVGPPVIAEARFVASVDPATGDPGPALERAATDADPRVWLRLSQMPAEEVVVTLRFTAPSGRSTVRPVLVADRTPLISVRLPDELGRAPGRYTARIVPEGGEPEVVELELTEADDESTEP